MESQLLFEFVECLCSRKNADLVVRTKKQSVECMLSYALKIPPIT